LPARARAQTFAGHGDSINDIALVADQPALFLTASKDEAIRRVQGGEVLLPSPGLCACISSLLTQPFLFFFLCEVLGLGRG